jgi:probable phosphoglycerate mutase
MAVEEINTKDLGVPCQRVYINTKFGPLKFNDARTLVVHLMVYDADGHQSHVLNSPFTCYDWERSQIYVGRSLREMFPVLGLQPGDFVGARRGLENYLDDLNRGVISYRCYEFDGEIPRERTERANLTPRQRGEYAFHIIRNMVSNYAKMLSGLNLPLKGDDFYSFWNVHLPLSRHLIPKYRIWEGLKLKNADNYSADVVDQAREFLVLFHQELWQVWETALNRKIILLRHAETCMNDGSFLGQGRDPDILNEFKPLADIFVKVYSSPLKRALTTASQLKSKCIVIADNRLVEEDYGVAEGLSYSQLKERYPEIVSAWQRGEDPCFPHGENTEMVERRAFSFLESLHDEKEFPILVVTHNVVLRCLLGRLLGIARRDWHKLATNHVEPYEVILYSGEFMLNLNFGQRRALGENLSMGC